MDYIEKNDTIEGAPFLREEDLKVFDCAFKPANGKRAIHYMGHVKMMAAVQPFLSGAISKTVNMPAEATPEEIAETYLAAWKMGLKAIAIYRDGSKRTQPLSTKLEKKEFKAIKRKLPDESFSEEIRRLFSEKKRKLSDFAGILSDEEGEAMKKYLESVYNQLLARIKLEWARGRDLEN